jgi:hypothetical protein
VVTTEVIREEIKDTEPYQQLTQRPEEEEEPKEEEDEITDEDVEADMVPVITTQVGEATPLSMELTLETQLGDSPNRKWRSLVQQGELLCISKENVYPDEVEPTEMAEDVEPGEAVILEQ